MDSDKTNENKTRIVQVNGSRASDSAIVIELKSYWKCTFVHMKLMFFISLNSDKYYLRISLLYPWVNHIQDLRVSILSFGTIYAVN